MEELELFVQRIIKRCRGYDSDVTRDSLADICELALIEVKDELQKRNQPAPFRHRSQDELDDIPF